ncbi:membrane protein [Microbacterium phage FuzzBuster]|uniref:Membrane protein n=1 Tax=Microbacterium phage FuzzBuster TaxID=2590935 RepID=A0A516KV48_9CAUD|nr:membrane protein [Microbacterium phage FuzzBuster]
MKSKIIAGAVALLLGGAGALIVAAPASAHTPTASATCEALDINATYYDGTRPAQGEKTVTVANPDYVPATTGSPAVGTPTIVIDNPDYVPAKDAVYETVVTEREYKKWKLWWWDFQWFPASANPEGWTPTGNVKTTQQEVSPATPAVGSPTIEVANPAYVPAVPATPAIGEPTIVVDNPDYVPASSAPNTVTATIDGSIVLSESFGSSYSTEIPFADKYTAHSWSVTITAWNDPSGSKGWTKTISGTTTPCEIPVVPAAHNANGEAVCGAAWIDLYNQQDEYEQNETASYVIYVDGKFSSAHAVAGGEVERVEFAFPEDSGNHQIIVRTGAAQGDEFVFSLDVTSDCIAPQPEAKVDNGEWSTPEITCENEVGDEIEITRQVTTTPYALVDGEWVLDTENATTETEKGTYTVTADDIEALDCAVVTPPKEEEPTATPAPAAAPVAAKATTASADDTLATTGGESMIGFAALALAMIAAGAAGVAIRRRA